MISSAVLRITDEVGCCHVDLYLAGLDKVKFTREDLLL